MLPKRNRVGVKTVEQIFKSGRSIHADNLSFKFIKQVSSIPQISFIAPKSVAKLAVKRNSLRRLGYRMLAKHIDHFPAGILGLFIYKKYQDDALIIENEIKNILNKIN